MKIVKLFARLRIQYGLISLMLIGVSALVLGTLIAVFDPFQLILKWKIVMEKGSETFGMWRKPDAPIHLKVYIFNITNRDEYLSGKDEKLKFQEVGPYVYKEDTEHKNVTFNSNDTMTITPVFPLTWVPEMNKGREDDVLILPNIAMLSFASVMSEASIITRMAVNLLIHQTNSKPFIRQTAKEFMFGYETPLVTLGNKFLPSWIVFDKLGLIDRMYDFNGDTATIFTGRDDTAKSGIIDNYNRRPYLPQWSGAPCNKVSGASDGVKFPTLKPDDKPMFFRKSVCRGMPMIRVSNLTIHDGLPVYKYIFENGTMDNGAEKPENKCFCRKNKCLKSGLVDVTDCYYGFPIVLSYPNFYQADHSLLDAIEGMNPVQDKHETYFMINPTTGMPTQLYVRMQINLNIGDISNMANTDRCSNLVYPLVWTEIGFEKLPDSMLIKFFVYLRVGPAVFATLQYALLVGGAAFIALTTIAALCVSADDIECGGGGGGGGSADAATWRRESQTLTGRASPPVRVTGPAAKEMCTYYDSLLLGDEKVVGRGGGAVDAVDATGVAAARLNADLCGRLDAVSEATTSSSFAGSSSDCTGGGGYGDDSENDPMV